MRRLVGALAVGVLLLAGCAGPNGGAPQLRFAQAPGICRPAGQAETAALSVRDGTLWVSGRIATDTPAQHLVPELTSRGAQLVLRVTAIPMPGVSPLCLGMIGYEAAITDLPEGSIRVRVEHGDRPIVDLVVSVEG